MPSQHSAESLEKEIFNQTGEIFSFTKEIFSLTINIQFSKKKRYFSAQQFGSVTSEKVPSQLSAES